MAKDEKKLKKFLASGNPEMVRMGIALAKGMETSNEIIGEILWVSVFHKNEEIREAAVLGFLELVPKGSKRGFEKSFTKIKNDLKPVVVISVNLCLTIDMFTENIVYDCLYERERELYVKVGADWDEDNFWAEFEWNLHEYSSMGEFISAYYSDELEECIALVSYLREIGGLSAISALRDIQNREFCYMDARWSLEETIPSSLYDKINEAIIILEKNLEKQASNVNESETVTGDILKTVGNGKGMSEKIHYEMTGSPREAGFSTKKELIEHLEGFGYVKDDMSGEGHGSSPDKTCDLLLTDSYDAKSSKMKKAGKLGIRIVTYQDLLKELE